MIKDLITKNRSYRRFFQDEKIEEDNLRQWIDLARLSPSGANLQPLKYLISNQPDTNEMIFPTLSWAGYLKEWPGPEEGERPAAYIIILGDKAISKSFGCDHGIAAQSILLGAVEAGLGGCILGAIDRPRLAGQLQLTDQYELLLVIALGKPRETVVVEPVTTDIKYWRDSSQIHHVPKRSPSEIILKTL